MALNSRCRDCRNLLGPEDNDGADTQPDHCARCRAQAKLEAERLADESNPFALHNRLIKVTKLVEEIDRQCGYAGVDPHAEGYAVARMVEGWTDQQWGEVSAVAGTKAPSGKAREMVIERYRERVRLARERRAS